MPGQPRAFRRIAAMSSRELLRGRDTGLSAVCLFAVMLAMYLAMSFWFVDANPRPRVELGPGGDPAVRASLVAELEARGLETAAAAPGPTGPTDAPAPGSVRLALDPAPAAHVLVSEEASSSWGPVWRALRAAGVPGETILVTDAEGDVKADPLRFAIGPALMAGIAAMAFVGTTVSLVAVRERGMLRLLGTTPLRRSVYLLAQLPARAAVIALEAGAALLVAGLRGYLGPVHPPSLLLTLGLGTAMLFAFALLFAGRARSAEGTQQGMVLLAMAMLWVSGGFLPPGILPPWFDALTHALPSTWFAAALSADLVGLAPLVPLPALWALMAATTALVGLWAVRRFEWDQAEPRTTATAARPARARLAPAHPHSRSQEAAP